MKINMGCGRTIMRGWVNVDKFEYPLPADIRSYTTQYVKHDLNTFPYPFEDNSADYIILSHVLEHLDDVVAVMEECYRILKPRGKLEIVVPYYKSKNAFSDPTHKHFFTEKSMDYFTGSRYDWYSKARFIITKFEKYRNAFPFWHINKYAGVSIKFPLFADTLRWVMEAKK